jgi:hypothetical protein
MAPVVPPEGREKEEVPYLRSRSLDLKLLHPSGHVLEIFSALHLLKLIPNFEDEAQAVASFRPLLSYSAKL